MESPLEYLLAISVISFFATVAMAVALVAWSVGVPWYWALVLAGGTFSVTGLYAATEFIL